MSTQPNVHAIRADINALHQQMHDAGLLSWEQFIPDGIKSRQRLLHLGKLNATD